MLILVFILDKTPREKHCQTQNREGEERRKRVAVAGEKYEGEEAEATTTDSCTGSGSSSSQSRANQPAGHFEELPNGKGGREQEEVIHGLLEEGRERP